MCGILENSTGIFNTAARSGSTVESPGPKSRRRGPQTKLVKPEFGSALIEFRTVFTRKDGTVVYLPAAAEGETKWLTADVSGILLDMTQTQPARK